MHSAQLPVPPTMAFQLSDDESFGFLFPKLKCLSRFGWMQGQHRTRALGTMFSSFIEIKFCNASDVLVPFWRAAFLVSALGPQTL